MINLEISTSDFRTEGPGYARNQMKIIVLKNK